MHLDGLPFVSMRQLYRSTAGRPPSMMTTMVMTMMMFMNKCDFANTFSIACFISLDDDGDDNDDTIVTR